MTLSRLAGSWSIELSITKDPAAHQITAEITLASTVWEPGRLAAPRAASYNFAELITYGTNACVVTGDASVTYRQDGSLSFYWQSGGSLGTGTLYRVNDRHSTTQGCEM